MDYHQEREWRNNFDIRKYTQGKNNIIEIDTAINQHIDTLLNHNSFRKQCTSYGNIFKQLDMIKELNKKIIHLIEMKKPISIIDLTSQYTMFATQIRHNLRKDDSLYTFFILFYLISLSYNNAWEDYQKFRDNILNRIIHEKQQRNRIELQTTLSIVGIEQLSNQALIHSCIVGDSKIIMIQDNQPIFLYGYMKKGGETPSYICCNDRIVGGIYESIFRMNRGDIFIISTDGAKLSHTTPGGEEYYYFINELLKFMRKYDTIIGFSTYWIKKLLQKDVMDDDASIAIIALR
jgi:hypothetical protein